MPVFASRAATSSRPRRAASSAVGTVRPAGTVPVPAMRTGTKLMSGGFAAVPELLRGRLLGAALMAVRVRDPHVDKGTETAEAVEVVQARPLAERIAVVGAGHGVAGDHVVGAVIGQS